MEKEKPTRKAAYQCLIKFIANEIRKKYLKKNKNTQEMHYKNLKKLKKKIKIMFIKIWKKNIIKMRKISGFTRFSKQKYEEVSFYLTFNKMTTS